MPLAPIASSKVQKASGYVHEGLYEICFSILNTTAKNTAIIFYRTPSFDARLTLTDEVVEACFPPLKPGEHEKHPALKEWRAIHKTLSDLMPIRNALAHQSPTATGEPIQVTVNPGGPPQFIDLTTMSNIAREWMEVRLSRSEAMRGKRAKVTSVRDTESQEAEVVRAILYLLIKAALSGAIVAAASEIAKRWPGWGGLIASLPLVSVLGMIWLWRDTQDTGRVSAYVTGALWFFAASIPMFVLIPYLLKRGMGFWPALASGCLLTIVLYSIMVALAPRVGIRL